MSDDLKPCPFCACDQLKISPNIHTGLLRVQCEGCWATSVTSNNRANLIAAWNRRAADAEIERLRAAVVTAKREALEEAAQIVQRMDVAGLSIADMIRQRSRAIAAIRALQEPK